MADLRFVIGAIPATAVLGVAAFGIFALAQLMHQAKVGPREASRTIAYADPTEWNELYDSVGLRRPGEPEPGLSRGAEAPERDIAVSPDVAGLTPAADDSVVSLPSHPGLESRPARYPQLKPGRAANKGLVREAKPLTAERIRVRQSSASAQLAKPRVARSRHSRALIVRPMGQTGYAISVPR
jgi:hypothetical protein